MGTTREKGRSWPTPVALAAAVAAVVLAAGSRGASASVSNPPLGEACGFDVVLVMDESGSISSSVFASMQAAFVLFVEALNDTPTEFALVDFGYLAHPRADFQSNGGIITAINAPKLSGSQYTNWQEALDAADDYFHGSPPQPGPPFHRDNPDLIIFASDGNPNVYGSPYTYNVAQALATAVASADHLKGESIRILPIAIGNDLNLANMEAISGPGDVIQSDFDQLAADLAELALQLCGGTITAHKVIDCDGNPTTTNDQSNGEGWTFNANADPPDSSTPPSGQTDNGGKINFEIALGADGTATVDVVETPQASFGFVSASCVDQGDNPVGTPGTNTVANITVGPQDIINCTFYNQPDCSGLDDQCSVGVCNPATGDCEAEPANEGGSCNDGQYCTNPDTCQAGACTGPARNCGDTNVCTDDSCDEAGDQCVHTDNTAPCNDGNACTTTDTCSGGACLGGPALNCNDGNVCTDDTCNPATGCVHTNNTAPCEDGNLCRIDDTCSGGVCVAGPALNCDDGNVCTDDTCNSPTGCVHTNNTASCTDGNACTTNDTCSGGVCVAGPAPNCDDGNVCTNDTCNPATGCVHTNNTASCDDGGFCTDPDSCQGGTCTGPARACGDGNECTADNCDEMGDECVNDAAAQNGASCADGFFCTDPDTCQDGTCGGPPRDCSDEVGQCYVGSCDEVNDVCQGTPVADGTPCDDADVCTEDDVCTGGECNGTRTDPLCGLDHQKCYRAAEHWRFTKRNVMLEDQFEANQMQVVSPKRFCNPGDKNGEGIGDPTAHMVCYKISRLKGQPPFARRSVVIENQFGQLSLLVLRADSLCVPAEKDGVPSPLHVDHFKCYRARVRPKAPKFESRNVTLTDQFETKETQVVEPRLLCNPVDKNGEGIINPDGHLVCYSITDVEGQPEFEWRPVEIEDQFTDNSLGTRRSDCRGSSLLCVPSTKRLE